MSSTPSRRAILVGAGTAVAIAALPSMSAAAEDQVSPELLALIKAHKRAWDAFGDTITDEEGDEEADRLNMLAGAHEEACLVEIVVYRSKGPADDRAKGAYFRDMPSEFDGYSDKIIDRLLNA